MDHPRALFSSSTASPSAPVLPLCLPLTASLPLFLSHPSEASLSHSEQQDTLQEMALDSSLNYICKVSPTQTHSASHSVAPTGHRHGHFADCQDRYYRSWLPPRLCLPGRPREARLQALLLFSAPSQHSWGLAVPERHPCPRALSSPVPDTVRAGPARGLHRPEPSGPD